MNEREFAEQAEIALQHIEAVLEAAAGGVDYELAPGGVLDVEFEDGSKMVINRHAIAKEIWVAGKSGGYHFRWDGQHWVDTRSGADLMSSLTELVSNQAGVRIEF